jgi:histidyl-tRNA synthetase
VVVIAFSPDDMPHYFAVAAELRAADIAAEVYLGASGMKPQMKYADRRSSPAAIMLGGDEIAAGTVTIKDLDLGREIAEQVAGNAEWKTQRPGQITVPRGELVASIRAILGR